MPQHKVNQAKVIKNRRASFDYELGDTLVVGLELTGPEVKNLRLGHGHLRGAYVNIKDNELILTNATIAGTSGMPINELEQTRPRKLLAKRREIEALVEAKKQGRAIIPLEMYTTGRYIKLKIAIAKGRKRYDKRQSLKAKDQNRQINRALKHKA